MNTNKSIQLCLYGAAVLVLTLSGVMCRAEDAADTVWASRADAAKTKALRACGDNAETIAAIWSYDESPMKLIRSIAGSGKHGFRLNGSKEDPQTIRELLWFIECEARARAERVGSNVPVYTVTDSIAIIETSVSHLRPPAFGRNRVVAVYGNHSAVSARIVCELALKDVVVRKLIRGHSGGANSSISEILPLTSDAVLVNASVTRAELDGHSSKYLLIRSEEGWILTAEFMWGIS